MVDAGLVDVPENSGGTYTLTITSRTEEVPLSNCLLAGELESATVCRVVHGTAHATLLPQVGAAGFVTLDATF